jgi:hypothetical protein
LDEVPNDRKLTSVRNTGPRWRTTSSQLDPPLGDSARAVTIVGGLNHPRESLNHSYADDYNFESDSCSISNPFNALSIDKLEQRKS